MRNKLVIISMVILSSGLARADSLQTAEQNSKKNPDIFKKQQEKLCEHFCYKIDGNSGKRLFEIISKSNNI